MTNEGNFYIAASGKGFSRKADGFYMGTAMDLGTDDSIENYEEVDSQEAESEQIFEGEA